MGHEVTYRVTGEVLGTRDLSSDGTRVPGRASDGCPRCDGPLGTCMCMCYGPVMRTTIELTRDQRERLLATAARRGAKGFSAIVGEALDRYFDAEADRVERVDRALEVIGSLSDEEADRMDADAARVRGTWR